MSILIFSEKKKIFKTPNPDPVRNDCSETYKCPFPIQK